MTSWNDREAEPDPWKRHELFLEQQTGKEDPLDLIPLMMDLADEVWAQRAFNYKVIVRRNAWYRATGNNHLVDQEIEDKAKSYIIRGFPTK